MTNTVPRELRQHNNPPNPQKVTPSVPIELRQYNQPSKKRASASSSFMVVKRTAAPSKTAVKATKTTKAPVKETPKKSKLLASAAAKAKAKANAEDKTKEAKIPAKPKRITPQAQGFVFNEENFVKPNLPANLKIHEIPLQIATAKNMREFGCLIDSLDQKSVEKGNFEIVKWPVSGRRPLDPGTGDEAGTTEGKFKVEWRGDYYYGENCAIHTCNNKYLDGLGEIPEKASHDSKQDQDQIHLWMSDYHPDGGQLFWSDNSISFVVCLGPSECGDDPTPKDMRAFRIPAGKGVYINPNIWHNGVYVEKKHSPQTFTTRQGRIHARVSASWASEFKTLLRIKFN